MAPTGDSKSEPSITSPSSESQTYRMGYGVSSTPTLPSSYHYTKAGPSTLTRSSSTKALQSQWHSTSEDALQPVALFGRTHKTNFSVGTLISAHSDSSISSFGSKLRHIDPKSISGSEGVREAQIGESKEPRTLPLTGGRAKTFTGRIKSLEQSDSGDSSRNQPTISLKLKLPRFKIGKSKSPYGERPKTSPGLSSRAQSPFPVQSPISSPRPRLSDETFNALGALQFENQSSRRSYLITIQPPNSEEGDNLSLNSPGVPTITQQDSVPQTPSPITPSPRRPESTTISDLSNSNREEGNLKFNNTFHRDNVPSSVIRSAQFLQTRTRPVPTITQDDISLNKQSLAEKRESFNHFSRRASLSTASMSSSTTPSQHPSSHSHDDGSDHHHRPASISTSMDPGYKGGDKTTTPCLSPITFEPFEPLSPPPYLDLPRTPTAENSSMHDDEDTPKTPIAIAHPGMPFSSWVGPDAKNAKARQSTQSLVTTRQSSSGTNASRTSSPDTSSRPRTARQRNIVSPEQVAQWEKEREIVTQEIMHTHAGEACIVRFEPSHKWMGIWNRPDIEDVIMGLRDLRAPKV